MPGTSGAGAYVITPGRDSCMHSSRSCSAPPVRTHTRRRQLLALRPELAGDRCCFRRGRDPGSGIGTLVGGDSERVRYPAERGRQSWSRAVCLTGPRCTAFTTTPGYRMRSAGSCVKRTRASVVGGVERRKRYLPFQFACRRSPTIRGVPDSPNPEARHGSLPTSGALCRHNPSASVWRPRKQRRLRAASLLIALA
jgi:hypothetical protein